MEDYYDSNIIFPAYDPDEVFEDYEEEEDLTFLEDESSNEINLHKYQSIPFNDMFIKRTVMNGVVSASRGFGKTILGAASVAQAVSELTDLPPSIPNKNAVIVCPTYSQTVDVYYPILAYQFGLESYSVKHSRADGFFRLHNAVELKLISGEAVERQRGKGNAFVLIDELTSFNMKEAQKEDMVDSILMPTITTRWSKKRVADFEAHVLRREGRRIKISPGRSLTISTPKGEDAFYDLHNRNNAHTVVNDNGDVITIPSTWKGYHYDYTKSPYLDEHEISLAADTMDPIRFNREYRARFEGSGSNVFYCFERKLNVLPIGSIVADPTEALHIAIDFNVRKQCSSVWIVRGEFACCIDYLQGSADTDQLGAAIHGRYVTPDRSAKQIYCYPDPSGRSAKTSAVVGTTDLSILEGYGFQLCAHNSHPSIVDSVNATNARFLTAANPVTKRPGIRYAYVLANCKPVIESLARTQWVDKNSDSAMIDKSQDVEHFSDGIRYFMEYRWPIRRSNRGKRGFAF
jgi:hypothetical protein